MKRKQTLLSVILGSAITLSGCGEVNEQTGTEPAGGDTEEDHEAAEQNEETVDSDPEETTDPGEDDDLDNSDEAVEEEEQSEGDSESETDAESDTEKVEDSSESEDALTYTNSEFGYSITFPDDWEGIIEYDEEPFSEQIEGALNVSYVPEEEIEQYFFSIIVLSSEKGVDYLEGSPWVHLESSDDYIFAYTLAGEPGEDLMEPENERYLAELQDMMYDELPEVLETFTRTDN
ncbi:hypothetical protein [Alteribacter natronophilus]|uniref:hypothetical protein n=1 Tax=Alteribacter natronophilus TaxID=2583810 RepID=UPI00110E5019|nr:hypothetical protein [Alteribacter natronophilus]TMW72317.1 hypothetical protein FGB90_08905 [Alteribacter natronophilus]